MSRTVEENSQLPRHLILLSVFIGIYFSFLPLPYWALWFRPELALMVVIYWVITFPFRFGIIFSGIIGLIIDILEGGILGQNALAFIIISYICLLFYTQLRMFTLLLQSICIFFFSLLYQLIIFWICNISGGYFDNMILMMPAIVSCFFWSVLKLLLDRAKN